MAGDVGPGLAPHLAGPFLNHHRKRGDRPSGEYEQSRSNQRSPHWQSSLWMTLTDGHGQQWTVFWIADTQKRPAEGN